MNRKIQTRITYSFPKRFDKWYHIFLANTLQDSGSAILSPEAGGERGDIQAKQKQYADKRHFRSNHVVCNERITRTDGSKQNGEQDVQKSTIKKKETIVTNSELELNLSFLVLIPYEHENLKVCAKKINFRKIFNYDH